MKIIYFDIDGTLRDENSGVSEKTKYMINECKKNGIFTVVCTGRNVGSIQQDIFNLKTDGLIYGGGCCVTFKDKLLKENVLPVSLVLNMLDKIERKQLKGMTIETKDNVYMNEWAAKIHKNSFNQKTMQLSQKEKENVMSANRFLYENNIKSFEPYGEDVFKMCLVDDRDTFAELKEELEGRCNVVQFIKIDTEWLLECTPLDCDKGSAINFLNEFLGIKKNESMSFGDGENDITMFEATGTGIAMKDSSSKTQSAADAVCGSVKEDGIYKELVNRKLIKECEE
ncbi:HAD family hydrolase [Eubacterium sp. MSJ-13]|uniref:HAD family hydrolase n=1 Tax=Eubacterium sp. MSJ-13 TaxID=2841513 RepID=UPI001C110122|nr:HAD family hydrolase [Eubacterium sp. MSJ-13]MBU5477914.1 HAD family hydrolase [Eubacterium sp. MSJ-13]